MRKNWQLLLALLLILLSALLYLLHYGLFGDAQFIFRDILDKTAFVPIQVLLITLILDRLLSYNAKKARLKKLNMLIGTFFVVIGTKLLALLSDYDPNLEQVQKKLLITDDWNAAEFAEVHRTLSTFDYSVQIDKVDLDHLRRFLREKRDFLVQLLANPTLLEHESFTDLLWATFHIAEELASREHLAHLPPKDYQHLEYDIKRVYETLVHEWLDYMHHLKDDYPFLFSHAMRTNPFDQTASPIIQ
jgi:hypothetical protein